MRKWIVIVAIVLIVALIPIAALAKPEPNRSLELTTIQQHLDPELHVDEKLYVLIDEVNFEESVADLHTMLQPETWEQVTSSNAGAPKLTIRLGDSYVINICENCATVFDGYASLRQESTAYYKIPEPVHAAVDAYVLSHAENVASAKKNYNLDPRVIREKLENGKSFRVNSYGNVPGDKLLTALIPDTWVPMDEADKPQSEQPKLIIYLADNQFYYITVYKSYICVRDDLRIPQYKDSIAYYSIPAETQTAVTQLLKELSQ